MDFFRKTFWGSSERKDEANKEEEDHTSSTESSGSSEEVDKEEAHPASLCRPTCRPGPRLWHPRIALRAACPPPCVPSCESVFA